jgi:hypothetical protein
VSNMSSLDPFSISFCSIIPFRSWGVRTVIFSSSHSGNITFISHFRQKTRAYSGTLRNRLSPAESCVNTTLSAPAYFVCKYQRLGRFALLDLLEKGTFSTAVEAVLCRTDRIS